MIVAAKNLAKTRERNKRGGGGGDRAHTASLAFDGFTPVHCWLPQRAQGDTKEDEKGRGYRMVSEAGWRICHNMGILLKYVHPHTW